MTTVLERMLKTRQFKDSTSFSFQEITDCICGLGAWKDRPRLPGGYLRMIHSISFLTRSGGKFGKGYATAECTLDPGEQVFKDHFADDPVFPGSLQLEMIAQLGGFLGGWYHDLFGRGRAVGVGSLQWFQQILPDKHRLLQCRVDLFSIEQTAQGVVATFDGSVKCDDRLACRAKRVQTIILPLAS